MHICELKYRMRWPGTNYNIVIKKVTKYKTDELRNQTFVFTLKVRNVMKLLKQVGGQDLSSLLYTTKMSQTRK